MRTGRRFLAVARNDKLIRSLSGREEVENKIRGYEKKYGMSFASFDKKMQTDEIPDSYSYEVEQDYLFWEAAVSDRKALRELAKWQA